jgi:hypothetical protein
MNSLALSPSFFHMQPAGARVRCGSTGKHSHILRRADGLLNQRDTSPIYIEQVFGFSAPGECVCVCETAFSTFSFVCSAARGNSVAAACRFFAHCVWSLLFGVSERVRKFSGIGSSLCCDEFYCCWRRSSLILHNALSGCIRPWPCAQVR